MNILVLNGSPKGDYSITLQTVRYLEKKNPAHRFDVLHVGQKIKSLEKDFTPVLEAVKKADMLLFAYPVYTFIAPSQLHRLIELLKASGVSLHAANDGRSISSARSSAGRRKCCFLMFFLLSENKIRSET